jgi:hypothetical protein
LSVLSQARIRNNVIIPDFLSNGSYKANAIKKYNP